MEMKLVEETLGASYDQLFVIKGRRSKRPRPASLTSSSSIGGTSEGHEDGQIHIHGHDRGYDGSSSSVAMSTIEFFKNTEEEEDMANCLILLARGNIERRQNRLKNTETREGLSGYECKTCNRSFGSFQALGGHRASHRKPKPIVNEESEAQFNTNDTSSRKHVFLSDQRMVNNNKSKVHDCSICGAEFSSGQALGGHMRRHRNATTPVVLAASKENSTENSRRNVFSLDLNLPAPEEDLEVVENNEFSRLPQPLIFSASSAIVNCHY